MKVVGITSNPPFPPFGKGGKARSAGGDLLKGAGLAVPAMARTAHPAKVPP